MSLCQKGSSSKNKGGKDRIFAIRQCIRTVYECILDQMSLGLYSCIGDADITEKPVEPIKVYSEKELIREFEKIASTLVPEKDWSIRISAMQRIEAIVIGGMFSTIAAAV